MTVVFPSTTAATLGQRARAHVANLISVFDLEGSRALVLDTFDLVTRESLALDVDAPVPRFSTINSDGIPLEVSVSLGGGPGGLRLLTEIGVPGSSVPSRINLTCARLGPVLRRLNLSDAAPAVDTALAALLPQDARELMGWMGGLWVALGFVPGGGAGLRLYVNAAVGDRRERWLRAGRLLARLGRLEAVAALCDLSPVVSAFAEPLGVAVDVVPGGIGRVKVYLRTTRAREDDLVELLASLGLGASAARLHQFLASVRPPGGLPASAVVLSLEFPAGDSRAVDVKIDACSHCCFGSDEAVHAASTALLRAWDLGAAPYEAVLHELVDGPLPSATVRHHAFLGLGLAHTQPARFNVYLKPALVPRSDCDPRDALAARAFASVPAPATAERSATARRRPPYQAAIDFLLGRQSRGGQWIDFELPVGPSDGWVTSYVGLALAELPAAHRPARLDRALERAADWCAGAMGPDHGWGYNAFTGSDADSSAFAIRFLRAVGRAVPAGCHARLRGFQRTDGGFGTYARIDPKDSWGHSHADVTPNALLALALDDPADATVAAGVAWSVASQAPAGWWPSFWWRSHDYATWANVRMLSVMGSNFAAARCLATCVHDPMPAAPFEASLRLATLAIVDPRGADRIAEAREAILAAQQLDGSWPSSPMLRLTDPRCPDPWAGAPSGTLYPDARRIFTTATVLASLVAAEASAA